MGLRRQLGPPGHGILFVFLFATACGVGVAYAITDRVLEAVWPQMGRNSSSRGDFLFFIREDGQFQVIGSESPEFESALSGVAYKDNADHRVFLRVQFTESREKRWFDVWSASRLSAALKISKVFMYSCTGAMLDADEQPQVLKYYQRHPPGYFPALLKNSSALSVTRTDKIAVMHNLARWSLVVVAPVVFGLGSWRIVRAERRYEREYARSCVACGYSLVGLPGDRCPECGREQRTPRPAGGDGGES